MGTRMKLKYFMRGLGAGILFTTIILMVYYNTSSFKQMSEDDIITEAKKLGMVYEDTKEVDLSGLNLKEEINGKETTENEESDYATTEGAKEETSEIKTDAVADKENSDDSESTSSQDKETIKEETTNTEDKETTKAVVNDTKSTKSKDSNTDDNDKNIADKSTSSKIDDKTDTSSQSDESEDSDSITIVIKPGMYASSVASLLVKKGIIDNEKAIIDYLKKKDWLLDIKTGQHKIPKETTIKEIAEIITSH
jgi:hypothetical protein